MCDVHQLHDVFTQFQGRKCRCCIATWRVMRSCSGACGLCIPWMPTRWWTPCGLCAGVRYVFAPDACNKHPVTKHCVSRLGQLPLLRHYLEVGQDLLAHHIPHLPPHLAARAVVVMAAAWHDHQVPLQIQLVTAAYERAVHDMASLTFSVRGAAPRAPPVERVSAAPTPPGCSRPAAGS